MFCLTGHSSVGFGSSELLLGHVFVGDRLHNIWSCDEQIGRVLKTQTSASFKRVHSSCLRLGFGVWMRAALYLNHEGEICQGGGVDRPSCTGTHNEGDLRDHS